MIDFKKPLRLIESPHVDLDVRPDFRDSSRYVITRNDNNYIYLPRNGDFRQLFVTNDPDDNYGWTGMGFRMEDIFENYTHVDLTKPVETITGDPVRIVITDGPGPFPVVGFVREALTRWTEQGFNQGSVSWTLRQAAEIKHFYIMADRNACAETSEKNADVRITVTDNVVTNVEHINAKSSRSHA